MTFLLPSSSWLLKLPIDDDDNDYDDDKVESDNAIITLPTQDVFLPSSWLAGGVRNKVSLSSCITEASWVGPYTKVMASL